MNKIIKLQKKVTFETITEDFLIYKKQQIKESTYFNYTYKIQKYLLPVFKDLTLEEIAKYDFNKFSDDLLEKTRKVLNRVANRDNTIQFYDKLPTKNEQYFLGREEVSNQDFLGIVEYYDEDNQEVTLRQKNYFKEGDIVEFFGPNIETFTYTIPKIYDEENDLLDVARHPEQVIKFKLNKKVYVYDMMRVKVLDKE